MKGKVAARFGGLAVMAALLAPAVVDASSVVYDFTGTVTDATGIYAGAKVGSTVTGTYTINFGAGDPSLNNLPVNNSTNWSYVNQGGQEFGTPLQNSLVFSSTLSGADGISYKSTISGTLGDTSQLSGGTGAAIPFSLVMGELALPTTGKFGSGSEFILQGNHLVWDSQGLPVFGAANISGEGQIATYQAGNPFGIIVDQLDYNVNSLTMVKASAPELDPASIAGGATLLIGLLALLRSRRKALARRRS